MAEQAWVVTGVGIGEEQEIALSVLVSLEAGPWLAEPAGWKLTSGYEAHPRIVQGSDLSGSRVGGPVVDDEELKRFVG